MSQRTACRAHLLNASQEPRTCPDSLATMLLRPKQLRAVLFDMDGLLVDTEPQWFAAEKATVAELGGSWGKAQQADLLGSNLDFAADYMIAHTDSGATRTQVKQMLSSNMTLELAQTITLREGAAVLLEAVAVAGIPTALVTSSVREHVDLVVRVLPAKCFSVIMTADDVEKLKPDPAPYLAALRMLDVEPAFSVVLEDSPPGVASAQAAGCHVVAVPSVVAIAPGPGRTVVRSLADVTLERLQSLV